MDKNDLHVVTPDDLGRGLVKDIIKKKYEVDLSDLVDGTTIKYEGGKLKGTATGGSGGLDCDAIGALKKVQMDKTTTVLGKKGDECVQVAVLDSLFQDVGVGISADKYSGYENDKFNVKITVTNTGEGTNEHTTLRITKPQLGSYSIENQSHRSSGTGSVTKVSDTEYTIKELARGGTVIVTFDVIGKSHGTYQFGASVDPDTALDFNAGNHHASITLSVNTKADPTYEATEDCPAITVTDVELSKTLFLQPSHTDYLTTYRTNYYEKGFTNRRFRLDGASTIVVADVSSLVDEVILGTEDVDGVPDILFSSTYRTANRSLQLPFFNAKIAGGYTFSDGIFTITDRDIKSAIIAMRPAGRTCKWQVFSLSSPGAARINKGSACDIDISGGGTNRKTHRVTINDYLTTKKDPGVTTIDTNRKLYSYIPDYNVYVNNTRPIATKKTIDSVVITVPKLTATTIRLTSECYNMSNYTSKGAVAFTPSYEDYDDDGDLTDDGEYVLTIHVSDKAMPTDSITLGPITLNVVD